MSIADATETLTTCPYCGHTIGATERDRILRAENERIESRLADRLDAERVKLNADMTAKLSALETAKREAEDRTIILEREMQGMVDQRVAADRMALEAELAARIKEEMEKSTRLEEEVSEMKANMQTRVEEQVEAERLRVESELHKDLHDKGKKLELANKTIETLKKQIEGKTAYELGGIQEEELVELLRGEFPRDRIHRITGRAGADIEHEVIHEGEKCGLIIYESKNVQGWQNEFIAKLHRDKLELGAAYGVLVSTAFPEKQRDFCLQDGICIAHPRLVAHLVRMIRQSLVDLHLQSLSGEERGFKLEQLMIFLCSPDFKNKMLAVFRAVDKLEVLQAKERKTHDKTWGEQTVALRAIRNSTSDVQNEISAILAGR